MSVKLLPQHTSIRN